jgi:hypothetical protein
LFPGASVGGVTKLLNLSDGSKAVSFFDVTVSK